MMRPMGLRADDVTRPREWIASMLAREPRFLSAAPSLLPLHGFGSGASGSTPCPMPESLSAAASNARRSHVNRPPLPPRLGPMAAINLIIEHVWADTNIASRLLAR